MGSMIQISPETYQLLQRRAREMRLTPEQMAETAIRAQFGNTAHLEQRVTPSGAQTYIRGTRVAVRHIAALLQAGHTVEAIIREGLPQLPPAAVHEAVAYYYDHPQEIEAELAAQSEEAAETIIRRMLPAEQAAALLGQAT
jgi:uncharacterized protein (DUF433 family)